MAENWFFILVLIGFLLMMSRHGGCGMHGGHGHHEHKSEDETKAHEEDVHAQHH